MSHIVVGTSSWADPGFVQEWYPPGLPARDRLSYYAERFAAVEVNATHYAVPAARTVANWAKATPEGFTFDVKVHRLLSRHAGAIGSLPKALRDDAETTGARGRVKLTPALERRLIEATLEAASALSDAGKLSSWLVQLSPAFSPKAHELDELAGLVRALSPTAPVAIELRHRGWVQGAARERTLGWLEDHEAAYVCVDAPEGTGSEGKAPTLMPNLDAVTHPRLAYLRAHGRNLHGYTHGRSVAERFGYRYDDDELAELADRAGSLGHDAEEVRMMFNNNRGDDAPVAAERLNDLLHATA